MKRLLLTVLFGIGVIGLYFWTPLNEELQKGKLGVQDVRPANLACKVFDSVNYVAYENEPANWKSNNKFGIYIYSEVRDFFELAQNLVNSNGGAWGYALIPYNVKDRDFDKWNVVFTKLKDKKIIPIIQLWDVDTADYKKQTEEAALFLNQFIWPIKYRYISVYNEPNDARFWYGRVDPKEYAEILDYTINTFKGLNKDYQMMNAGFNASAPNDAAHMDSFAYMKKMDEAVPGIFNKLDAWASHSYPQPNFSGNPHNVGRWSIKAYDTELDYLKTVLKVEKELPVYITETGWAHAEGEVYNSSFLPVDEVGNRFVEAFKEIWLPDDRVRAVIIFTIWYDPPFDHFSMVNKDRVPYKHYFTLQELPKVKGNPPGLKNNEVDLTICR